MVAGRSEIDSGTISVDGYTYYWSGKSKDQHLQEGSHSHLHPTPAFGSRGYPLNDYIVTL